MWVNCIIGVSKSGKKGSSFTNGPILASHRRCAAFLHQILFPNQKCKSTRTTPPLVTPIIPQHLPVSRSRPAKGLTAGISLIPKTIIDDIANGENALRVLRRWRGMTQLMLSCKTDLNRRHISDLANRRRKGTFAIMKKIAKAINVPPELLV